MKLPKFLKAYLPSYDISKMDLENPSYKKLIIEAILNQGGMKEIKWLFRTYNKREIKNVLKNPRRGCWDVRVLNFWTKFFGIRLKPIIYEMAILDLIVRPEKQERWLRFIRKHASKETRKRWLELGLIK